jgi:hypothetical protein
MPHPLFWLMDKDQRLDVSVTERCNDIEVFFRNIVMEEVSGVLGEDYPETDPGYVNVRLRRVHAQGVYDFLCIGIHEPNRKGDCEVCQFLGILKDALKVTN